MKRFSNMPKTIQGNVKVHRQGAKGRLKFS